MWKRSCSLISGFRRLVLGVWCLVLITQAPYTKHQAPSTTHSFPRQIPHGIELLRFLDDALYGAGHEDVGRAIIGVVRQQIAQDASRLAEILFFKMGESRLVALLEIGPLR